MNFRALKDKFLDEWAKEKGYQDFYDYSNHKRHGFDDEEFGWFDIMEKFAIYYQNYQPKSIETLTTDDYIAFEYDNRLEVAKITSIHQDKVLVHWLVGIIGESQSINKKDIVAIGCNISGDTKLPGWRGKFIIVDKNHKLLK